jgi:hypothetical protein
MPRLGGGLAGALLAGALLAGALLGGGAGELGPELDGGAEVGGDGDPL